MLNFGPYWYEPDSSNATRPNNGDVITVYGGLYMNTMMDYDMLIVYEINNEFWREPYEPLWNYLNGHMHGGGHHNNACNSYGFNWNHDTLSTVTVTGTALVDTTFRIEHYYLDENNDSIHDYMLNFGPPWYEPQSGAKRPHDGDQITVTGGYLGMQHFNMLLVYEINGLTWLDSLNLGNHYGGGWMHNNAAQPQKFHSTFDDSTWMVVHPGWRMGGMQGGMMMPDSIFTQMLEIFPQNLPNSGSQNIFAGFQFNMMYPDGQHGMGPMGGCGSMMQFNNNLDFQLYFNDMQLKANNIDKNKIKVKYYDGNTSSWIEIPDAVVNTLTNTVTFSKNNVSNFIILTGEATTDVTDGKVSTINDFELFQNYPNPFNPSTTINFKLKEISHVVLSVYNVLGQKLFDLVNSELSAGIHNVKFDAENLSSGIYFYKLKAGSYTDIKKMLLLK